jgi:hypothetical protein
MRRFDIRSLKSQIGINDMLDPISKTEEKTHSALRLYDYTEFHGESHLPAVLFGGECQRED